MAALILPIGWNEGMVTLYPYQVSVAQTNTQILQNQGSQVGLVTFCDVSSVPRNFLFGETVRYPKRLAAFHMPTAMNMRHLGCNIAFMMPSTSTTTYSSVG